MSKRSAAVYERRGTFYVVAKHRTEAGFSIESPSVDSVDSVEAAGDAATPDRLAALVRAALASSRTGVPTPPSNELTSRVPEAAGAASFAAFATGAVMVHVGADGESTEVVLTPMRIAGASRGFQFCTDQRVIVDEQDLAVGLTGALAVARAGC